MSIILTFLLINNKVFAQEDPEEFLENPQPLAYSSHFCYQENAYTYECNVFFSFFLPIYGPIEENDYFLVNNLNVVFRKGLNRNTNSYEYLDHIVTTSGFTEFTFTITVLKSIVIENFEGDITPLFENHIKIYVDYYVEPINPDYELGFRDGYNNGYSNGYDKGLEDGYNQGYDTGYNKGYNDGARATQSQAYQRGYNEGLKDSFYSKFHVWIVPAIIVVVIAGIFVGYRREKYGGD